MVLCWEALNPPNSGLGLIHLPLFTPPVLPVESQVWQNLSLAGLSPRAVWLLNWGQFTKSKGWHPPRVTPTAGT